MFRRVYLDNAATTPVAPEVLEAMLPLLTENYGNASSIHFFGQQARAAVDRARHQVAALVNARPSEIIFTSGGTEANNLAIKGILDPYLRDPAAGQPHIVTGSIEHPAVKSVCEDLERAGIEVTYVPVPENGVVEASSVLDAVRENTVLVSIMAANNEIGTIQPVQEIGRGIRELRESGRKIFFHTDAVQAAGKVPVDVHEIGCDLLSLSGHKIYGAKGVGGLYVRRGVRLHPQNIGGRQERGFRGGTEPVAQIAGFGVAAEAALCGLGSTNSSVRELRDKFEDRVLEMIDDVQVNGSREKRLPGISNLSFGSIEGEGLLINLDMQGVAVSTGSACSSGSLEPSPVIRALGRDDAGARGAIRFSFGRFNTMADVDRVLEVLPRAVEDLRRIGADSVGRTK